MSKVGVALKIDVSKVDKDRLYQGQKGKYLDATAFIDLDELDQYGQSGMITQDVNKDERQQGTKGAILGNAKVFWKGDSNGIAGQSTQQQSQGSQQEQGGGDPFDGGDPLPF